MFHDRQNHGVMPRPGRGRCRLLSRRVVEVNLLIIGALIFVGIGIASLQSDVRRNAALESPDKRGLNRTGAAGRKTSTIAPKALVATVLRDDGGMVRTAVLQVALPNQILTRATTLVAAQRSLQGSALRFPSAGAAGPGNGILWVRSPHPLAVPVAFGSDSLPQPYAPAVFTMIPVVPGSDDHPAPLVRLDTRTGPSPFWYVMGGIMLVTFASGFLNSRKGDKTKGISTLSV